MNWALLQNSLVVAVSSSVLALLFGGVAALFLCSLPKRWQRAVAILAIIAFVLPPFLHTSCWLHLLGANGFLRELVPLNIFSLEGTIIMLALIHWPIAMFFVLAAWSRIEAPHFESDSALRGAKLLKWLLIPAARQEIGQAAVVIFVLSINQFSIPAVLQVKVLPSELWVAFNTTLDYRSALVFALPLVVFPLVLLFLFRQKPFPWRRTFSFNNRLFRKQIGPRVLVATAVFSVVLLILSVGMPVGLTVGTTQTWTAIIPAFAAGNGALMNSVAIALLSATVSTSLSLLVWRRHAAFLFWLTFLIPGVVLGMAAIYVFNRPAWGWFYGGLGIVITALVVRYFSPSWTMLAHAMRSMDGRIVDAARIEGAKGWALFRHAHFPQIILPVCCAWYATYLFCLWDVETLLLIVPPGRETAALRVFNLLHYGYNSEVNALCFWLLVAGVLPLIGFILSHRIRRAFLPLLAVAVFVLVGCSEKPVLHSRLFGHVEIIGSRGTGMGQFNKPRSLAVDRDDNLYVVDMTGRVQKFSPDGKYLMHWQMPQTDLGRPKGMNIDAAGNVIVIEPHYSRVNHFNQNGELIFQWGVHGTNNGQLAFPRAVAINSRGEMYLSEFGKTERVQQFSPRGETFLNAFGEPGSSEGKMNRPEGLDIDPQGRVYVADSCNHRVQVFSASGEFLKAFGGAGSAMGEFSYPYDIRIDVAGYRFVCEFGNSRIQVFDSADQPIEVLGRPGAGFGEFANPWSIAVDSKGNLYVADSQNHRVQKLIRKQQIAFKGGR